MRHSLDRLELSPASLCQSSSFAVHPALRALQTVRSMSPARGRYGEVFEAHGPGRRTLLPIKTQKSNFGVRISVGRRSISASKRVSGQPTYQTVCSLLAQAATLEGMTMTSSPENTRSSRCSGRGAWASSSPCRTSGSRRG
jgi:hypothetical protein